MKLLPILLLSGLLAAQEPKKLDRVSLRKADPCHYIMQGAKPAQLRSLNQQRAGGCIRDWRVYASEAEHIAALRLYRAEVEIAFPPGKRTPELAAYLRAIDAEEVLWW